jgi:Uma2 family endonuclease
MNARTSITESPEVVYPESDGLPMADNTLQFEWITKIEGGLDAQYADDPLVFVAGDCFWYPVEGDPNIRVAPDTLVVFGRPKGHRSSYRQWEEGGIAPQVVFEILSPGNRAGEMSRKFDVYQTYGVEEYYLIDPDRELASGWLRSEGALLPIPVMAGWVSPRLQIQFVYANGAWSILGRDGRKFLSYPELAQQRSRAEQEKVQAQERADRLAAQLRALGIEPSH